MMPVRRLHLLAACLFVASAWTVPAIAAPVEAVARDRAEPMTIAAQARALSEAHASVVGVRAVAVDGARSARTLGPVRQGSGVQIDADGLVLTIGYLILEAEHVELLLEGERSVPARVVAYDVATGFGLVQSLAPLRLPVAPLGEAARLTGEEPLLVASGGDEGEVSMARMVSRRPFSGFWEYHLDSALFTSPPRGDHSGAGLFNGRGELVGVGSLLVMDAAGPEAPRLPGNMFVPVDLLRPILGELRQQGASADSRRAWMGVNCVESEGEVRITRVNEDSPADVAGLQEGDRILRIDGAEVRSLEALWKTLWRGGASEREVTLEIRRGDEPQTLKLQSVDRMKTLRRPQGI